MSGLVNEAISKLVSYALQTGLIQPHEKDWAVSPPAQVIETFLSLFREALKKSNDWYCKFSEESNCTRQNRIVKDIQWKAPTEYSGSDITIDLSKPEKASKAIATAKSLPTPAYSAVKCVQRMRATRAV